MAVLRNLGLVNMVAGAFLVAPSLSAAPFSVARISPMKRVADHVLFATENFTVNRQAAALDRDFRDLYWLNLVGSEMTRQQISRQSSLLHFEPGEFAIVRASNPDSVVELSAALHTAGKVCGSVFALRGDSMRTRSAPDPEPIHAVGQQIPLVEALIAGVNPSNIDATVTELSEIHTRRYNSPTGIEVPQRVLGFYKKIAGERDDITLTTFDHSGNSIPQDSVIVRIEGQSRPEEIIVLGSHIDSIAFGGLNARSPGADDNASGTATNLEIFRLIIESGVRLQRTVEIHGYAAEEIGLRGSQQIAEFYRSNGKQVVAMVQHDMNLYVENQLDKIWFVTNNTNAALNQGLAKLAGQYLATPVGFRTLSGGSSDHYSWTRQGFAAAFPFEDPLNYNPHIHTPRDTIDNSGKFSQSSEFARLGLAYVVHYAGLIGR